MLSPLVYLILGYITLLDFQSSLNASSDSSNLEEKNDYKYTSGIGAHKLHKEAVTWNEARRACQKEGGYLAIMNSVDEVQVVSKLLDDAGLWQAFLGFHDIFAEGDWVTIHDEPLEKTGFAEWLKGEPSGTSGAGKEDCGGLLLASKKLNDVPCSYRLGFICELIIVPSSDVSDD